MKFERGPLKKITNLKQNFFRLTFLSLLRTDFSTKFHSNRKILRIRKIFSFFKVHITISVYSTLRGTTIFFSSFVVFPTFRVSENNRMSQNSVSCKSFGFEQIFLEFEHSKYLKVPRVTTRIFLACKATSEKKWFLIYTVTP